MASPYPVSKDNLSATRAAGATQAQHAEVFHDPERSAIDAIQTYLGTSGSPGPAFGAFVPLLPSGGMVPVGTVIPNASANSTAIKESIRLPYTSGISSTNKTGKVVNLLTVGLFPDGTMPYANGWLTLGDNALDYIHCLTTLDLAGSSVIDMPFVGNREGLYNTRFGNILDSTVTGYDTLTTGFQTMNAGGVGFNAGLDRLIFNSGKTVANSLATFKNLGAVQLLSDTMQLQFGAASDAYIAHYAPGQIVIGADVLTSGRYLTANLYGSLGEANSGAYLQLTSANATPATPAAGVVRIYARPGSTSGVKLVAIGPNGVATTLLDNL